MKVGTAEPADGRSDRAPGRIGRRPSADGGTRMGALPESDGAIYVPSGPALAVLERDGSRRPRRSSDDSPDAHRESLLNARHAPPPGSVAASAHPGVGAAADATVARTEPTICILIAQQVPGRPPPK